jgi:hypothetical protein
MTLIIPEISKEHPLEKLFIYSPSKPFSCSNEHSVAQTSTSPVWSEVRECQGSASEM